jgi:hypothetical protein
MLEPIRRGRQQQPSGQFHVTSFNIDPVGVRAAPGGQAAIRLSALLAAFALIWSLVTDAALDTAESAFIATMLGFAWHAGVNVTWDTGR